MNSCATQPKKVNQIDDIKFPVLEDPPIEDFRNIYDESGNIKEKAIPYDYYRIWVFWTADTQAVIEAIKSQQTGN